MDRKKVVVIGGGTGTFVVLNGLKKYPLNLTVIVTMMDSGGSNRIIRDEFGLLPTSDLRQCIVALSQEKPSDIIRKLFTYRYNAGTGITGMTFGNLFMAALTDIYKSQEVAIRKTCEFLDVEGKIIPVTYDDSHLVARYDNGKQVLGERYIDDPGEDILGHKIVELEIIPKAKANKDAVKAILDTDLVILGPGDLYTSVICNLVVEGISKALKNTKARIIYVINLMTKYGETNGFKSTDHVRELEKYIGRKVDICLMNSNHNLPLPIIKKYKQENAYPVKDDLKRDASRKIIRCDLLSAKVYKRSKNDLIKRSFIRHDPDKLAKAIIGIMNNER